MEENGDHRNWFGRNWKWVVPSGGCLILIIIIIVGAGSLFVGITSLITDSTPYKEAMARASVNEIVLDRLGEPIESHGITSGDINFSGSSGHADIQIPIKGPKGKGLIIVASYKENDVWTYEVLKVNLPETNEEVNLLLLEENLEQ